MEEVDQIFENVWKANKESDENPESLRISIDAKAKLKIGNFSRGGKSRDTEPKKADDHDMNPDEKLVPSDIVNDPPKPPIFWTVQFNVDLPRPQ
ncbi:MAG: hypothetical protein GY858_03465 [Candidatus Omnitrophica bacterium]|nr:hypothetical protein [Candidatus Omnitrophota bacterium]